MPPYKVEERLAIIETQLAELKAAVDKLAQPKDWRSAVGMFAGDEVMERIFEQGRKIREADRRKTQPKPARTKRKVRS